MRDPFDSRRDSRELRVASGRLRERAGAESQRSARLREESASAIARAVILKTVFVARRIESPPGDNPALDHALFSAEFLPKDRAELLAAALHCAKRVAGTGLAAIQLRDCEGALRIEAQCGLAPAFVRFFDGMSTSELLREKCQVFIPDVASDALLAGTGSGAVLLDAGIVALASTPIVHESNVVIGLLSAYYREPTARAAANLDAQQMVAARLAQWLRPETVER